FWVKEIIKSKFTDEDKQKLNKLREEHIRELEQTQPGTNDFNQINEGICDEKQIGPLEIGRRWFREIRDSRNLTEQQKVMLNIKHDEQLKALSNKQYDKISEEIPKIDAATPLNNRQRIDIAIRELKNENFIGNRNINILQQMRRGRYQLIEKESEIERYNRYRRQITNFYNNRQVVPLSNNNTLANNIERLNQTLMESDRIKNDLVNLRKHRYNTLLYNILENEMKEDNDKQSFEDGEKYDQLIQTLEQDFLDSSCTIEQLQELRKQLFSEQKIKLNQKRIDNKYPYRDYIETLLDGDYFDNKINKLTDSNEKYILQNLCRRTAEIYKDKEQDQYFIDKSNKQFHSICDIEDVNEFVNNIIKKNYLYKQIKEIFDQEDDIARKEDDFEQPDNKKQKQAPRKMKNVREGINIIIPKTRLFLMRQGYQTLDIKICVEELLKLYKAIIIASDKEISFLRSLLLNNIIKYSDPSIFNRYDIKSEQNNKFFINSRTITKQHFLDIVFKILIKRDRDLRLDEKIGNIFDDTEV
ncbi:24971_t:CDS:2, partial [Cetraspora pellucida]